MSQSKRTSTPRRFGAGVVAGALTSAGLALTAESPGWFGVGAGVITAAGFIIWVGGSRFKITQMGQEDRIGPAQVSGGAAVHRSIAVPESIHTSRLFAAKKDAEDLSFRDSTNPAIARMDVLIPAEGSRAAIRTSVSTRVPVDEFETLQQPRRFARVRRDDAGAISLGAVTDVPFEDVPDPASIPSTPRLPGARPRIGRVRRSAIATIAGFTLAAGATMTYLPDTSVVSEAVDDFTDQLAGYDLSNAADQLEDVLQELAEVRPKSVDLIRSFEVSQYGGWTLTALDPDTFENFTLTDTTSAPNYSIGGMEGEPFAIDQSTIDVLDSLYDKVLTHVDESDLRSMTLGVPEGGTEPLFSYEISPSKSSTNEIQVDLDGTFAPIFKPLDVAAAFDVLLDAMGDYGITATDSVWQGIKLRASLPFAPDPGEAHFLEAGGIGGQVLPTDGGPDNVGTLSIEVGKFPTWSPGTSLDLASAPTFALSDVSAAQVAAILKAAQINADVSVDSKAEAAVLIVPGSTYGLDLPVVEVWFVFDTYCAQIDGTTVAC